MAYLITGVTVHEGPKKRHIIGLVGNENTAKKIKQDSDGYSDIRITHIPYGIHGYLYNNKFNVEEL